VLDTTFRDRVVIGAGATYARSATGGTVSHAHGGGSHTHSSSALGVGGTIDAASGSGNQANVVTPNPVSATQAHTHTHSLDVTGATDAAGIATDTQNHLPPYIAAHYIRKT
jgi:hypothetical protein